MTRATSGLGRSARLGGAALVAALFLAEPLCPAMAVAGEPVATVGAADADYAADGDRLFRFLAEARTEAEGRAMEDAIWLYWMKAPDAASAALMNDALARRRVYDLAGAAEILDRLIAAAPDWAEAWNQRATVRFEQQDLEASLADIAETLRREPRHFGALAGLALIYLQQGRGTAAQEALRRAVAIHPYLRERTLLVAPGKPI